MGRIENIASKVRQGARKRASPEKVLQWHPKSGFHTGSPHRYRRFYFDVDYRQLNYSIKLVDLKRYFEEKKKEEALCARMCREMCANGMQAPQALVHALYVEAYEDNVLRNLGSLIAFLVTHAKNGGDKIPADCNTCDGLQLWRRGIIDSVHEKRRTALEKQSSHVITVSARDQAAMALNEQGRNVAGSGFSQLHKQ